MAPRDTAPHRPLVWAAPKGNYWDWIQGHLHLPSIIELESQQLLTSSPVRNEMLASATCWVLGVEGRYDTDLQGWLLDALTHLARSPDKPKAKSAAKPSKSLSKSTASTKADAAHLLPSTSASPWRGAVLLGESWAGHRRTFPLPDSIVPFYWYELYDRFLPWVFEQVFPSTLVDGARSKEPGGAINNKTAEPAIGSPNSVTPLARGLPPRVSEWIDASRRYRYATPLSISRGNGRSTSPFALVIAESFATSLLWEELLGSLGVPCMITRPGDLKVQVAPDLVFVDLDANPRNVKVRQGAAAPPAVIDLFNQLRQRFPDALLAGFDSFPRWSSWQELDRMGVDALFPKPFSTFGLQWCIRRWIDPSPPGTME
jgi:hypothetical protein